MSKAQCRIAGNGARAVQYLRNAARWHVKFSSQLRRAHLKRFQLLGEVFPRMNGGDLHSGFFLMIVDDLEPRFMPYRTSRMRLRSEVQPKTALGPLARPSRQALVLLNRRTKSPDWEIGNGGVIERGTPSLL
jgi:hypothetical protein